MEIYDEAGVKGASQVNNVMPKNKKRTVSLFYIRGAVCFAVFLGVVFVRLNNPPVFESFRMWYQNNVCEEKFSAEEIKKETVSLFLKAKERVLSVVSKIR